MTPEKLAARRLGIGGSDIGAIAGLSPWKSPLTVYLEKRGLVETTENEWQAMGRVFEPAIIAEYERRTGFKVRTGIAQMVDAEREWKIGNPDGIVVGDVRGVEAKNVRWADGQWGDEGTDAIPQTYIAQCHWYMGIAKPKEWDVAVVFGGCDFCVYRVPFNPRLSVVLTDIGKRFWYDNVQSALPPPPEPRDGENIAKLFPASRKNVLNADGELNRVGMRLAEIRAMLADLEAERDACENRIKLAIGGDDEMRGSGWGATWRTRRDSQMFDAAAAIAAGVIPPDVVEKFTKPRSGGRPFLFKEGK